MSVPTPPLYRCPTCKSVSANPRNLAVFIDGTSNKPGPKETNVMKLHDAMSDGEGPELEQRKIYFEGIGASVPSGLGKQIEMAFARNVETNVKDAYQWLAETYQKGDRVYLFGFSRGAYQVRALASMIHEVGLVKENRNERIEQAYRYYDSIDSNNPDTRNVAQKFKKSFCWPDLRIHFIGVWDTVSSLGLIKRDVHITASASVTNACHFRHALALDERRVKFMPELFREMNPHRSNIQSPRSAVSDVKEVWFAGCHSDVGGTSRPHSEAVRHPVDDGPDPVHAGNVPLLWMCREAAAKGLVFQPGSGFGWGPDDVDLGRVDTMESWYKYLEFMPIRHQVSFSGTGKHERRWLGHRSRPRLVIPDQQVHFSALPGDVYTPRATLAYNVDIPTVPQKASGGLCTTDPWETELPDEGETMRLLTSLLSDQQKALKSLGEVLPLLHFRMDNGQTRTIPTPPWLESIQKQSDSDKFALIVIYDVTANFSISQELVKNARDSLCTILPSPKHSDFPRVLYILRFSARHRELRRRFIAHDEVIKALMLALEQIAKSRGGDLYPLVMDSLYYLIDDDDQRTNIIKQLTARLDGTAEKTILSLALEMKATDHLRASLKMIACVAQYQPELCEGLKPRIIDLVREGRSPVGSEAIGVLIALKTPLPHDIHFSNILCYLGSTLPPFDAEVGSTSPPRDKDALPPVLNVNDAEVASASPPDDKDALPPVFGVNDANVGSTSPLAPDDTGALPTVLQVNGSDDLDEQVMRKLVKTIESRDAHDRTGATLTLLKLCKTQKIREFCSKPEVLDIFIRQLERKETSLLAAYALKTCLRHDMWKPDNFPRAPQLIVAMFDKGWFDDAVGRIGGFEIFGELMTSGDLKQKVISHGIITTLTKKLEGGDPHGVRMSLLCLEILGSVELTNIVADSLTWLRDKKEAVQRRGIKILSALARTADGEEAIKPHVIDIVKMLHPPSGADRSPLPRSQLFGATAVLYNLCRNETLRKEIRSSEAYATFKDLRNNNTIYPKPERRGQGIDNPLSGTVSPPTVVS